MLAKLLDHPRCPHSPRADTCRHGTALITWLRPNIVSVVVALSLDRNLIYSIYLLINYLAVICLSHMSYTAAEALE